MSEENEFDGNEGEGIKSLRKEYNALKKQLEEQSAALGKYQAAERRNSVATALKAKFGDTEEAKAKAAKAASLYTGDDVSEDAVGKWLESYADVFGVNTPAPASQPDANALAAQRAAEASFEGLEFGTPPAGSPVHGDLDELTRAMQTLPVEELVKRGLLPDPSNGLFSR
jgi:hypothetical protein